MIHQGIGVETDQHLRRRQIRHGTHRSAEQLSSPEPFRITMQRSPLVPGRIGHLSQQSIAHRRQSHRGTGRCQHRNFARSTRLAKCRDRSQPFRRGMAIRGDMARLRTSSRVIHTQNARLHLGSGGTPV